MPPTATEAFRFLALCARPHASARVADEIAVGAARIIDWDRTLTLAEHHGIGPLLHQHLRAGLFDAPPHVANRLWAHTVRVRHENGVRLNGLRDVLAAFDAARIPSVVLKGPALIAQVYGDPGLRPFSDLDLLVPTSELRRAQAELFRLGFQGPAITSDRWMRRKHHLAPAVMTVQGVVVAAELHWNAIATDRAASLTWSERAGDPAAFEVGDLQAFTLAPIDMLWHLCHHLTGTWHPLRLIWFADIVGLTALHGGAIDWRRVSRERPYICRALEVIDCLTPLSDDVKQRAGLGTGRRPRRVGEDYTGWPRSSTTAGGRRGWLPQAARTLAPPEWWSRLRYGVGLGRGGALVARLRHQAALVRRVWRSSRV
jgi:hypothetical protein